MLPIYIEIPYKDPIHYYEIFHDKPWSCFFDGGPQYSDYSQYSFLAIDPFATLVSKDGIIEFNSSTYTEDPFNFLEVELARYVMPTHSHLPPFQGGVAGHFAYDLRYHLEELPSIAIDDMHFSDMALGFYDLVLAFDLQQCKAWAISNGFPFVNEAKRRYRAEKRLQWLKNHIQGMHQQQRSSGIFSIPKNQVKSNFSRLDYEKAVKDVIKYILEGDVFEVNISQRFKAKISMEFNTFYKNFAA